MICSQRQHNQLHPQPRWQQLALRGGICVPLFNPDCHTVRQVESARNPLLLHLSSNQRSNGHLLQVCQTDAFPDKEHSRNGKSNTQVQVSNPDMHLLCDKPETGLGHSDISLKESSTENAKILQLDQVLLYLLSICQIQRI